MSKFDKVKKAIPNAKGIAWDGCHKIYVLMDDEQVAEMVKYGYEPIKQGEGDFLALLQSWYNSSCPLRFIQSIRTDHEDPNDGFESLIPQD